jgi:hypothetical protein
MADSALPDAAFLLFSACRSDPALTPFPAESPGFIGFASRCIKFESIAVVSNFSQIQFKYKFN